jgi:hypothetical protein
MSPLRHASRVLPLLLAAGCPAPPVERPRPAPTAGELLGRLAQQAESVRTLRAEAKVDYMAERAERVKVRMTMLVASPDKLRLEAENPLGGPLASLASDGRRFELLNVRENRFLDGEATPCNIGRLIRIELPPEAVVAVIEGGAPIIDARGGSQTVGWDAEHGRDLLTLKAPSGRSETIAFDARDRRWDVVAVEVRAPDGHVELRIAHEGFAPVEGGQLRLPELTIVEQPPRHADARIRFKSREVGVAPPEGAFQLTPPPGLPVETVTCD